MNPCAYGWRLISQNGWEIRQTLIGHDSKAAVYRVKTGIPEIKSSAEGIQANNVSHETQAKYPRIKISAVSTSSSPLIVLFFTILKPGVSSIVHLLVVVMTRWYILQLGEIKLPNDLRFCLC